jgi:TRAP-type C4-dicarboxylate transport system permease large subunit
MDSAIRGVWPFLIAEVIVLALLIIFPQLVTVPLGLLR